MCRIFPAPRLEHNPLHAELSVTSSALTSSDKSDIRLNNPSVRQAHRKAPYNSASPLDKLRIVCVELAAKIGCLHNMRKVADELLLSHRESGPVRVCQPPDLSRPFLPRVSPQHARMASQVPRKSSAWIVGDATAREISLAVKWMSGRSRAEFRRLMQLLRNARRDASRRRVISPADVEPGKPPCPKEWPWSCSKL